MSDTTSYTTQDLRSALLRRAANNEVGAVPEALSAPTQNTLNMLVDFVMGYDPTHEDLPDDVRDSEFFRIWFTRLESQLAWESVRDGDVPRMRAVAGNQWDETKVDTSSWKAADILTNTLWKPNDRDNMLNMIIYGPTPSIDKGSNTGTGKSSFAYLSLEGGVRAYESVGKQLQVATNNSTDPYNQVDLWSEAVDWMENTSGPKVLMLDEAAQNLMYDDQNTGKVLSKVIKLLRKYNCHLILIGHTGKDIPADVRRQVVFARKEDKYSVKLGNKLEEDQAGEMKIMNVEYELESLPDTDTQYDDLDDEGDFVWDIEEEKDTEREPPECQAVTNAGDECPNDAKFPADNPVVCYNHRNKQDEFL